jgi:hypothetical protein
MADYFCQFSCLLGVGSTENAQRAIDIRGDLAAEIYREEGGYPRFDLEISHENGEGVLWIYADEYGQPDHAACFVERCADAFDLTGLWGFTWSTTCSKPRIDTFGGGSILIDLAKREITESIDCNAWLTSRLTANQSGAAQPPTLAIQPGNAEPGR